jgi:hypothetical protein
MLLNGSMPLGCIITLNGPALFGMTRGTVLPAWLLRERACRMD